ncbi:YlmC/YmxH family sporulation protein [Sporohalobacter salinus]|uniref:YlmC/YmxH family sporulation protein n=1 Tax=Sporohalobacter salinus TaxID=1494606 RepID=UPI0019605C29|nr:YlmC/YmxH family sporulation protein [Sporohalobacter salinus]
MIKTSELKKKEVISVNGERLGLIKDIELDLSRGKIKSVVVPGERKFFGVLSSPNDLVINWDQIQKIGEDVILVNLDEFVNFDGDIAEVK